MPVTRLRLRSRLVLKEIAQSDFFMESDCAIFMPASSAALRQRSKMQIRREKSLLKILGDLI